LKNRPGKRLLALNWDGAGGLSGPEPVKQLVNMKPERFNITLTTRAVIRHDLDDLKSATGAEGTISYYHDFPKNPANDWLKAAYQKYGTSPPDVFAVQGFAAASAAITALARAGSTDAEKLVATMEGMPFETPKGTMSFRKEDHQALQDMYHWRMGKRGRPELVRTIPADEIPLPIVREVNVK
jgi:branched-chain amino acid transport system substrate-binding protein